LENEMQSETNEQTGAFRQERPALFINARADIEFGYASRRAVSIRLSRDGWSFGGGKV
jgi:hypothetical protein